MKKILLDKLIQAKGSADKKIASMGPKQRAKLEEAWDVEHAYYSSALEGSKLDRSEFEILAKEAK